MTKRMLVTDTHLGIKNGNDMYHNITLKLFEELCNKAKELGIKEFIHLGDFFDVRRSVSLKTIPIAYKIINMLKDTFDNSYLLVGNHDIYYKNQINPTSLQLFDDIEGISVVDNPIVLDNEIHLVPWIIDDFQPVKVPYMFGHLELSGIVINRVGTESKSGLSVSLFKDYKKVLSGHYHTRSVTKNITYLGSPFHMTFNDEGERGYYIFEDGELDFFKFDGAPKFHIFNYDNIDKSLIEGNNIKIQFTKDIGTTKINKLTNDITELKPNQLFVEFNFDESFSEEGNDLDVDEIIDIRSIEKKYLDNADIPEYIDRNLIDKHMDNLWKKLKA